MEIGPTVGLRPEDFRTPDCSEDECLRNTSPETIKLLVLGYLQAMTGQDWDVHVTAHTVENQGDMLKVFAQLNMSIGREKFNAQPKPLVVPK